MSLFFFESEFEAPPKQEVEAETETETDADAEVFFYLNSLSLLEKLKDSKISNLKKDLKIDCLESSHRYGSTF